MQHPAAAKRARILKEGALTLILYGADEALRWQLRVSSFLHAVRCRLHAGTC